MREHPTLTLSRYTGPVALDTATRVPHLLLFVSSYVYIGSGSFLG
jgi:hypothetical protein